MVMALDLYCNLLEEPGVFHPEFQHYAQDLKLVSGASQRLLERISMAAGSLPPDASPVTVRVQRLHPRGASISTERRDAAIGVTPWVRGDQGESTEPPEPQPSRCNWAPWNSQGSPEASSPLVQGSKEVDSAASALAVAWPARRAFDADSSQRTGEPGESSRKQSILETLSERRIENLADALHSNLNLMAALAGPGIRVDLSITGGATPVLMSPDDLMRVLVNLVRNAAEVMPQGGSIAIALQEGAESLLLTFADTGPGIPVDLLGKVFSPGYSFSPQQGRIDTDAEPEASRISEVRNSRKPMRATQNANGFRAHPWPAQHRGLGLSIVRAIVAGAGGCVWATNRDKDPIRGSGGIRGSHLDLQRPGISLHRTISGCTNTSPASREAIEVPKNDTAQSELGGAIIHIEFPLKSKTDPQS